MNDTDLLPQEIESLVAVAERHGARLEFAVIPERLTRPRNADGRMAAQDDPTRGQPGRISGSVS